MGTPYQHHRISGCLEVKEQVSVTRSILGRFALENNLSHGDGLWMCSEVCHDVLAETTKNFLHHLPILLPSPPPPQRHISPKPNKTLLWGGILLNLLCARALLYIHLVLLFPSYSSTETSLSLSGCSSRGHN